MKVWDLHCDTLSELRRAEKAGRPKSFAQNDLHIDLENYRKAIICCSALQPSLIWTTPPRGRTRW